MSRLRYLNVMTTGLVVSALVGAAMVRLLAQAPQPASGVKYSQMNAAEMKEWLTYLSSDALQGRQVFTEGYGLAASYVADHLKSWGLKPLGDAGTFFESVKIKGYKATRNSSISVVVKGETKTFKQGDHATFAFNSGGRQTLTFSGAEFVGYGQPADFQGRDIKGKLVIWMPNLAAPGAARGGGPGGQAVNIRGAKAAVGLVLAPTAAEQALVQAQDALQKANDAGRHARSRLHEPSASGGAVASASHR